MPASLSSSEIERAMDEYSSVRRVNVLKGGCFSEDVVIAEEPLELMVTAQGDSSTLSSMMRTPGNDFFLALGYLRSEGLAMPLKVDRPKGGTNNKVLLHYRELPDIEASKRLGYQSSSCGVCGKVDSLLYSEYEGRTPPKRRWNDADFDAIQRVLEEPQPMFEQTGGSHAVWLFDQNNVLVASFEDVGRHNALDKLLGWATVAQRDDFNNMTLVMSSRLSYELIHKAATLGVWMIVAMGAPSSLAVELSKKLDCTMIGFFKKAPHNLYTNSLALYYG